jgi:SNF2 family DNA or RNA helicase
VKTLAEQLEPHYELFPYQEEALKKFKDIDHVLCGDDMGIGKTLEAIATDREWRLEKGRMSSKTLVIAPLTVLGSWEDHYAWMIPGLKVYCIDPKDREAFRAALKQPYQVYLIHWDALRLLKESLKRVEWFSVIADECHRMKNRKTQMTQAVRSLHTENKFAASGTPADSKPHDLWSVLHWLKPRVYTSYWRFYKDHVEYTLTPQGYHKITGVKNTDRLLKGIEPFYLRRRKEEVLKDLPEKYYTTQWVDLTPQQRKAYDEIRKSQLTWVESNKGDEEPLPAPEAITRLIRLQQFAVGSIQAEHYQKRQLNKRWDPNRETEEYDREREFDPKHNWKWRIVNARRYNIIDPSVKINAAMDLLEDSVEPVVIFSQFKSAVNLLAKHMAKEGMPYGMITGDVSEQTRRQHIRDFQEGKLKCMTGTIQSGGVGITLTRASHVVFIDRSWKQAINRQAEDRLHRVGQKNAVQVTDFMARNTVDLGRHQQLNEQWTWLQQILGDSVLDYQQELTMQDLEKGWL